MDLKFYFCESCGKRLTNIDLEAGQARDKKLKGVYCKSCSVGVMTMDMVAVREEDLARKLPPATQPTSRKPQTKIVPERHTESVADRQRTGTRSSNQTTGALIGAAVALVVVTFGAIALTRPSSPKEVAATNKRQPSVIKETITAPAAPSAPAAPATPAPAPTPTPNIAPESKTEEAKVEEPKTENRSEAIAPAPEAKAAEPSSPPAAPSQPESTVAPPAAPPADPSTTALPVPPPDAPPLSGECTITRPPETASSPGPSVKSAAPAVPLTTSARIKQAISGELLKSDDLYVEVRYDFVKNAKSAVDFLGPLLPGTDGAKLKAIAHFDKEFGNLDVLRYLPVFQPKALQIEFVVQNGRHDIEVGRIGNAHMKLRWIGTGEEQLFYGPKFAGDVMKGRKWKHPEEKGCYRLVFERIGNKMRFLIDEKELVSDVLPAESSSEKEWFATFCSNNECVVKEVVVKGFLDSNWLKERTTPSNLTVSVVKCEGKASEPIVQPAGTMDSFRAGARRLRDRAYTWTHVPAQLNGQMRLQTATGDRDLSSRFIINISAPCSIYVAADPRHENKRLAWMDDSWTDSGLLARDTSVPGEWRLWKKEIPAAGEVTVGYDGPTLCGSDIIFVPKK